jgi:hypothetical protein
MGFIAAAKIESIEVDQFFVIGRGPLLKRAAGPFVRK